MPAKHFAFIASVACLATNAMGQAQPVYDGVVDEPLVRTRFDSSLDETAVIAVGKSWSEEKFGNVRLEVSYGFKGRTWTEAPRRLAVSLVHVGMDHAWNTSTRFALLADKKPIKITFARAESPYFARGVKIGIEEMLVASIAPVELKRFTNARHAQVKIGKHTYEISANEKRNLLDLIERPPTP